MRPVPRGPGLRDPELRDRLYELLEHDPLAYSVGSRFIQIIIGVIVLVNGRGRDWLGWVALIGGLAIVALSGILNRV